MGLAHRSAQARRRERSVYRMLPTMRNRTILAALALTLGPGLLAQGRQQTPPPSGAAAWPQWGGPTRNFMSDSKGLASKWPATGPKKVWSRALGEGHSSIAVDGGRCIRCTVRSDCSPWLDAARKRPSSRSTRATGRQSGSTSIRPPTTGINFTEGAGPHSTPLVTADRVFAVGSRKELFALNKANGQVVWSHDLIKEYGAPGPIAATRAVRCSTTTC